VYGVGGGLTVEVYGMSGGTGAKCAGRVDKEYLVVDNESPGERNPSMVE